MSAFPSPGGLKAPEKGGRTLSVYRGCRLSGFILTTGPEDFPSFLVAVAGTRPMHSHEAMGPPSVAGAGAAGQLAPLGVPLLPAHPAGRALPDRSDSGERPAGLARWLGCPVAAATARIARRRRGCAPTCAPRSRPSCRCRSRGSARGAAGRPRPRPRRPKCFPGGREEAGASAGPPTRSRHPLFALHGTPEWAPHDGWARIIGARRESRPGTGPAVTTSTRGVA
jgi:hypothetical protein